MSKADPPALPGECLSLTLHATSRAGELGRLLKSLVHVPPNNHGQAMAIYSQAMLEHGFLMNELHQLTTSMQAAGLVGLILEVRQRGSDEAGLVPVPCRTPPEVPEASQQYLVLERESTPPPPRRIDGKSLAAGEGKGED